MNIDLFDEQTQEAEEAHAASSPETHFNILVVDDEESMRSFAADALTYGGYHTVAVENCAAAIKALKADHFDLVVTDFNMPNGSGADLIIKMHSEGFTIPVIMMTGAALTKELLTLTSMLHVGKILQKPFRMDDLLAAVKRLLEPVQEASQDLAHHEVSDAGIPQEPHKKRF